MKKNPKDSLSLKEERGVWDVFAPWALLCGALLATFGFVLTFTVAPLALGATAGGAELIGDEILANKLLFSQKIFFFHLAMALSSMAILAGSAYFGIRFLQTKQAHFSTRGKTAMELVIVFSLGTLFSGVMWGRSDWGVWWTWEPRLTTYLILLLLAIGYFVLRSLFDEPEKKATYASIFAIIAFCDVPICFVAARTLSSTATPLFFSSGAGVPLQTLIPLIMCVLGMVLIAYGLFRLRLRQALLSERIQAAFDQLKD